jgi:DNA-binding NtrC family response regulator
MNQQLGLLFGTSRAIQKVLFDSARFAPTDYPILLLGAPGTGKSVLARQLHRLSARSGEFVKESAASVPAHLEVSHLVGHVRGAFTGADSDRIGLLEAAHHGTFFFDELGLASSKVQEILLHLLDDRTIRRVGEVRKRLLDVRFIAATNADLEHMIARGEFRRDLRDRFGYLVLRLPSLAERRDEILPLADEFLRQEASVLALPERPVLSDRVRACFLAAPWPGNIRELEAVSRYAVLHAAPGQQIQMDDLPADFVETLGDVLRARSEQSEADRVRAALHQSGGNKAKAARILGVSRQHFYRLLAGISALLLCDVCNQWTDLSGWLL